MMSSSSSSLGAVHKWMVDNVVPSNPVVGADSNDVAVPVRCVFVAFGGVICVALEGFPCAAVRFKEALHEALGALLPPENMGSTWAKITIAALKDDSVDACKNPVVWDRVRNALQEWMRNAPPLMGLFHDISLVVYENRSLSNCKVLCSSPLRNFPGDTSTSGPVDAISSTKGEQVVCEYTSNSNWPSYRDHGIVPRLQSACSYQCRCHGATVVAFLKNDWSEYLSRLRMHLSQCDCDVFEWMPEDALHMTVRAI
jgi:hypothetical protein